MFQTMQWIDNNKQWLFDGFGGALLLAIVGFLIKRFFESKKDSNVSSDPQKVNVSNANTNSNTNSVVINVGSIETRAAQPAVSPALGNIIDDSLQVHIPIPARPSKISKLKASQIRDAIKGVPILMKQNISQQYCGMFVEWKTRITRIDKHDNKEDEKKNFVRLMLQIIEEPHCWCWAYCIASLDDYKELNIAHDGTEIKVVGEIEKVDGHDFTLKNTTLYFD